MEGTILEGTLQECTLLEGTLLEGTLLEGTLLEGALLEGTLLEVPYTIYGFRSSYIYELRFSVVRTRTKWALFCNGHYCVTQSTT